MVKLFKNLAEPVGQQYGRTGPNAQLHVLVAPPEHNFDFLLNQKQKRVHVLHPPIFAPHGVLSVNGVNVLTENTRVLEHVKMQQMVVEKLVVNALAIPQKHAAVE